MLLQTQSLSFPLTRECERWANSLSRGQVVVIENFIDPSLVSELREDAINLSSKGLFRASGLTNTAIEEQRFTSVSDRSILALDLSSRLRTDRDSRTLGGNVKARERLADIVLNVASNLAGPLKRPTLNDRTLDHEAGYSIYQPGASLKRHMDEFHEEFKRKGWIVSSRRSVSWLVYLNSPSWDTQRNGGTLRIYTMPESEVQVGYGFPAASVGAHEQNLQVFD